jgi:ligand-binding SRPBCC domain-containing protein
VGHVHLETSIGAPIEIVFDVARDIDVHRSSMARTAEEAIGGRTSGMIGLGEAVTFRARHFGLDWRLTSRVTAFEPPDRFVDEQVRGPFAWFRHEHRFVTVTEGSIMIDDWSHASPLGWVGRIVDRLILVRYLRRQLLARAAPIREVAEGRSRSISSA